LKLPVCFHKNVQQTTDSHEHIFEYVFIYSIFTLFVCILMVHTTAQSNDTRAQMVSHSAFQSRC